MNKLKTIVNHYMQKVPEVRYYCNQCLKTRRWGSSILLMVIDAAFTSIGLNYFKTVVPKMIEFEETFVKSGKIKSLEDLTSAEMKVLRKIWKNKRSWEVAKSIASSLVNIKEQKNLKTDKQAFITWAKNAQLQNWKENPIGKIKGVGLNTFQYLRMMGGIDTVMPDKIVRRIITNILKESEVITPILDDIAFIETVHKIAQKTGYRPIELCWMTWLVQSEASLKYSEILSKIVRNDKK
ncbi:MAG: hypothetical protein HY929_00400 [Euryarchaeota archaeon]|nr:hypothetical protein [Euryarchaeota archaeon]